MAGGRVGSEAAFGWLGAKRSARNPKGLFAGETAFAVELLVTGFRAEGVVLVLYRLGQLGTTFLTAAVMPLCYIRHCTFVSLVRPWSFVSHCRPRRIALRSMQNPGTGWSLVRP